MPDIWLFAYKSSSQSSLLQDDDDEEEEANEKEKLNFQWWWFVNYMIFKDSILNDIQRRHKTYAGKVNNKIIYPRFVWELWKSFLSIVKQMIEDKLNDAR